MNGVLVIDKPQRLTSHDVVNRVRRILGQKSVGHLGTLDPSATGILPMVVGNLTRLAQFYLHSEKSYEGVIRFGFATDTYDADGEPAGPARAVRLILEELEKAAQQGSAAGLFVHPRKLLPQFPSVTANDQMLALIRHGRAVNLPELSKAREVKVFEGQERLIAIATRVAGTLFHAGIVFGDGAAPTGQGPKGRNAGLATG